MADLIGITQDIEPLVAAVEAFGSATAQADRARLLAQIRDQLEKLRTADEKSRAELEEFYESAPESDVGAANAKKALASREDESAAAKTLLPRILSLQGYLVDTSRLDDPEAHRLLQQASNILVGYVAGYQNLRDQLIRFDAERARPADKIMRARPVAGEIDYAELIRDTIAKFPKILTALAK